MCGRMLGELFLLLHASLLGLHLESCVQFWPLQLKKKKTKKTYRVSLVERHQNDDGLESYVCFKSSKYLIRL